MNMRMKQTHLFILLATVLVLVLAACQEEAPAETPSGETVAAVPASQAADTGVVTAEGQIVPQRAVDLSFETGGTVAEVLVSEGDMVEAGQPLIQLDSALIQGNLQQAQAGLTAAEANLTAAQSQSALASAQRQTAEAAVAAAEAQLALVEAGPRPEQIAALERNLAAAEAGIVQAAGQRSATLNVSDAAIRSAEAQLASATAQLTALQETYDTIITTCIDLPDGGEICPLLGPPEENVRAQLEAAQASREAAQLALSEAQTGPTASEQQTANAGVAVATAQRDLVAAQLALAQVGARPEQVRQAEVGVEQASLGLVQADVAAEQAAASVAAAEAAVQNAQAAVAAAQRALDLTTLLAPFSGTIGDVTVEAGELVSPGLPVTTLADISRWQVETTDLVELDIVFVSEGQPVKVTLDALPGEVLRGTVAEVGQVPQLVRGDITYVVRIDLDDYPELPIRWGMTSVVTLDAE